ncbi:MAG: T9SS type A sorting domain-containing protein, partial [Chitinophagaceae bacterium]
GGLIPIAIAAVSNSTTDFTAEHHAAPAASAGPTITASGLARISGCEYWVLTRVGTATANVTLYWNSFSNCNSSAYVTDLSTIVVAHSNGVSWDAYKRDGGTTGSAISGTVTWNTVNTFSPFALGSTSAAANPLPVLFDNVRAFEKGTGVQIEWSNLTERDLLNYQVEHSVNGRDYTVINQQSPKSNQNDKADYTAFDAAPASGSNFYRIKVQEVAGKIIYSKILRVEIGNVKKNIALYPNPVSGNQLTVALSGIKLGQYNVKVINASGQQVYQKALLSQGTSISQTLQLPSSVKTGIYTILVSGDDFMETQHFVVQ